LIPILPDKEEKAQKAELEANKTKPSKRTGSLSFF